MEDRDQQNELGRFLRAKDEFLGHASNNYNRPKEVEYNFMTSFYDATAAYKKLPEDQHVLLSPEETKELHDATAKFTNSKGPFTETMLDLNASIMMRYQVIAGVMTLLKANKEDKEVCDEGIEQLKKLGSVIHSFIKTYGVKPTEVPI